MHGPGDVVAQRYEITERLAVGGMGAVYRARHRVSTRDVALKIVHAHLSVDPTFEERFLREARVAAEIGHEGIVQVLDAGIAESGELFLAMELLEGESLRAHLERPGTTRGQALSWIDAMLEPLGAAHHKGFVHRDLKPENVFVARTAGGHEIVKLLDFGIAKQLGEARLTATGAALGTPHYMPPEQVLGRDVGPAADVWSVGVMIYEILSGAPPFVGPTPQAAYVRACTAPHAPLDDVAPGVGRGLSTLVDRMLDKEPTNRPQDAWQLREALRDVMRIDPDDSHRPVGLRSSRPPNSSELASRAASTPPNARIPSNIEAWPRYEGDAEGKHWTLSVPPGFVVRASMVPRTVFYAELDDSTVLAHEAKTSIKLKVEPFDGDTRAYVELGMDNLASTAKIHRTTDVELSKHAAFEVDATFFGAEPPVRMLHRAMVVTGTGFVMQAGAAPTRFPDQAPMLRAIMSTLRIG